MTEQSPNALFHASSFLQGHNAETVVGSSGPAELGEAVLTELG